MILQNRRNLIIFAYSLEVVAFLEKSCGILYQFLVFFTKGPIFFTNSILRRKTIKFSLLNLEGVS